MEFVEDPCDIIVFDHFPTCLKEGHGETIWSGALSPAILLNTFWISTSSKSLMSPLLLLVNQQYQKKFHLTLITKRILPKTFSYSRQTIHHQHPYSIVLIKKQKKSLWHCFSYVNLHPVEELGAFIFLLQQ